MVLMFDLLKVQPVDNGNGIEHELHVQMPSGEIVVLRHHFKDSLEWLIHRLFGLVNTHLAAQPPDETEQPQTQTNEGADKDGNTQSDSKPIDTTATSQTGTGQIEAPTKEGAGAGANSTSTAKPDTTSTASSGQPASEDVHTDATDTVQSVPGPLPERTVPEDGDKGRNAATGNVAGSNG